MDKVAELQLLPATNQFGSNDILQDGAKTMIKYRA